MLLQRLHVALLALCLSPVAQHALAQTVLAPELSDAIVAVVGTEPITSFELSQRVQAVAKQNASASGAQLRSQVLEALINERAQAQAATQAGVVVTQADVDAAEQTVAAQNQVSIEGLHQQIEREGLSIVGFRRQLHDQLLVQRIRVREVDNRIDITPADIRQFLQQQAQAQPGPLSLQVAHILVAIPEGAGQSVVATAQALADELAVKAKSGADFAALAREFSGAGDAAQGGDLGLRLVAELPPLFVNAVASLSPGGVSEVVRSGAGLHVVKLLKQQRAAPVMTVEQTRARHILLRAQTKDEQHKAVAALTAMRAQIVAGERDFASVAVDVSQDASAQAGGDLGWARPGMFVPEFEAAMDKLAINAISPPVVSRFGVHLIQTVERARVALSAAEQTVAITNLLREQQAVQRYAAWARGVRARAYVDIRTPLTTQ
jgi:peptidyl-prolyl cis-trans isomerase SurA